jgi:hypothetical protein
MYFFDYLEIYLKMKTNVPEEKDTISTTLPTNDNKNNKSSNPVQIQQKGNEFVAVEGKGDKVKLDSKPKGGKKKGCC